MTESERVAASIPEILRWYGENKRPLPWREGVTAYGVWVSEVMLQQTRIEAAIPYYLRFMDRLPTVEALARAPEQELLKLWEGLGYYSRARNMQKAARLMTEKYGGQLPETVQELRSLPGVGDYTAGAVASIALGLPEPAVDGNVLRVILRLTACREDALDTRTRARICALLRRLYPSGQDAAALTQGLMELGETVCLPGEGARCGACPLAELCLARERGEERSLPVRSPRPPRRVEERTVFLLVCNGKYAVRRRDGKGLLAGLWEFPNAEGFLEPEQALELLRGMGLEPLGAEPWGEAKHLFTHVEWRMRGLRVPCKDEAGGFLWDTPEGLRRGVAIPSAFRFWVKKL